ncbi:MAG: hypothetical protein ACRD9R_23375, partial [Pyrinomonadaceae bacterium]
VGQNAPATDAPATITNAPTQPAEVATPTQGTNGGGGAANGGSTAATAAPQQKATPSPANAGANGRKAVDFVSEDDVRRAIQKGEKIYVSAKTIITPSARDLGEPAEVFAKA